MLLVAMTRALVLLVPVVALHSACATDPQPPFEDGPPIDQLEPRGLYACSESRGAEELGLANIAPIAVAASSTAAIAMIRETREQAHDAQG